ncbi:MAG: hypothetical protein M0R46_16840 [Candidatus Muirbacterium halophilum]|nr:hypothetical protein [Candidatus Muirbacterium halophilum]MCK9477584.1 hypothetical protein [Candidatus Muirbacterium halophilum]
MKKTYLIFVALSIFVCINAEDIYKKELIAKARNFLTEKYNIKSWQFRLNSVSENEIRFNFYLKNYINYWFDIDIIFSDEYEDNMKLFSG